MEALKGAEDAKSMKRIEKTYDSDDKSKNRLFANYDCASDAGANSQLVWAFSADIHRLPAGSSRSDVLSLDHLANDGAGQQCKPLLV